MTMVLKKQIAAAVVPLLLVALGCGGSTGSVNNRAGEDTAKKDTFARALQKIDEKRPERQCAEQSPDEVLLEVEIVADDFALIPKDTGAAEETVVHLLIVSPPDYTGEIMRLAGEVPEPLRAKAARDARYQVAIPRRHLAERERIIEIRDSKSVDQKLKSENIWSPSAERGAYEDTLQVQIQSIEYKDIPSYRRNSRVAVLQLLVISPSPYKGNLLRIFDQLPGNLDLEAARSAEYRVAIPRQQLQDGKRIIEISDIKFLRQLR